MLLDCLIKLKEEYKRGRKEKEGESSSLVHKLTAGPQSCGQRGAKQVQRKRRWHWGLAGIREGADLAQPWEG